MSLNLPPQLEETIRRKVQSGAYASASDVLARALELLEEHEQLREIRLRKLREQVQVGLDQAQRGEVSELDFEQIKAEARRRHEAARRKESA